MKQYDPDELGPPDISIAGLQVWILGRQWEQCQDYWDGNWLNAVVHMGSGGSDVWVSGTIMHLPELDRWLTALNQLNDKLTGTATLECLEPNLGAELKLQDGRGTLSVKITADHLTEKHEFTIRVDQSYLRELISMLSRTLQRFPVRGSP